MERIGDDVAERHGEGRKRRVKECPVKGELCAVVVTSIGDLTNGSEETRYSLADPCESSWLRWSV